MKVLVVARTRMGGNRVCVGGIDVDARLGVRLLGKDEQNLQEDHRIRPGDIWEMACTPRSVVVPPHVEDVVVTSGRCVSTVTHMKDAILDLVEPWDCDLDEIFNGCLL